MAASLRCLTRGGWRLLLEAKPRRQFDGTAGKGSRRLSKLGVCDVGTRTIKRERRKVEFVEYIESVGFDLEPRVFAHERYSG